MCPSLPAVGPSSAISPRGSVLTWSRVPSRGPTPASEQGATLAEVNSVIAVWLRPPLLGGSGKGLTRNKPHAQLVLLGRRLGRALKGGVCCAKDRGRPGATPRWVRPRNPPCGVISSAFIAIHEREESQGLQKQGSRQAGKFSAGWKPQSFIVWHTSGDATAKRG